MKKWLPNLIIPGAGKSGTSSLYRYLDQHPEIYMSEKKEPAYFFRDELYIKELEWYSNLFERGKNATYRGEASTYYLKYMPALQRMKKDLKDPKFIILIRHPIKRVISHYLWLKGKGLEYKPFRKAVADDMNEPFRPGYHIKGHYKCYIQNSYYFKWIKNYFKTFGREYVYVLTSESLKNDPLQTMNSCFDFLGVQRLDEIQIIKHNKTIHRDIPRWDARILHMLFTEDDENLFFRLKEAIVPEFVKEFYYKVHVKLTHHRILNNKPEIKKEDYDWIKSLVQEDISELKNLLNRDFKEWEDL